MSVQNYGDLIAHYGHDIAVARYTTQTGATQAVAIECNDCNEVLLDYDSEGESYLASDCTKCGREFNYLEHKADTCIYCEEE